jgi:hypothetical protein
MVAVEMMASRQRFAEKKGCPIRAALERRSEQRVLNRLAGRGGRHPCGAWAWTARSGARPGRSWARVYSAAGDLSSGKFAAKEKEWDAAARKPGRAQMNADKHGKSAASKFLANDRLFLQPASNANHELNERFGNRIHGIRLCL